LTSCSSKKAQNPGTSGNSGAKAIPDQTKNKVTLRVPKRSIRTPIWIDKNKATIERAPTRMPISEASNPSAQIQSDGSTNLREDRAGAVSSRSAANHPS
jgi:hypothetical protein